MRTRRHALGQNFLHHKPTIEKIAALIRTEIEALAQQTQRPRALLEVGPGKLALTQALKPIAAANALPLFLVERDRYLEDEIRAQHLDDSLWFMDAATSAFAELLDDLAAQSKTPFFFASNLPYSAASQILANLCLKSKLVSGAVVMVQKEMAQRMSAPAKSAHRGSFSLLIQSYFKVRHAFDVGPGAFSPPPKVMSSVMVLEPLELPVTHELRDPLEFEKFCKKLFSQRRKMIRNLIDPTRHELFSKLGISGTERPETLELNQILELFRGAFEDNH